MRIGTTSAGSPCKVCKSKGGLCHMHGGSPKSSSPKKNSPNTKAGSFDSAFGSFGSPKLSPNALTKLPCSVLLMIAEHTDPTDVGALAQVSKAINVCLQTGRYKNPREKEAIVNFLASQKRWHEKMKSRALKEDWRFLKRIAKPTEADALKALSGVSIQYRDDGTMTSGGVRKALVYILKLFPGNSKFMAKVFAADSLFYHYAYKLGINIPIDVQIETVTNSFSAAGGLKNLPEAVQLAAIRAAAKEGFSIIRQIKKPTPAARALDLELRGH
jgi:hypothetical protein